MGLSVHASSWYAELRLSSLAYLLYPTPEKGYLFVRAWQQRYDILKLSPSLKHSNYKRMKLFVQIFSALKNPS